MESIVEFALEPCSLNGVSVMSYSFPLTFTGGARTGRVHSSWPFAKLTIDQDTLRLNANLGEYVFLASDPLEIKTERHFLLRIPIGVRFHHSKEGTPSVLVFWTFRVNALFAILKETGFSEKCIGCADEIRGGMAR